MAAVEQLTRFDNLFGHAARDGFPGTGIFLLLEMLVEGLEERKALWRKSASTWLGSGKRMTAPLVSSACLMLPEKATTGSAPIAVHRVSLAL